MKRPVALDQSYPPEYSIEDRAAFMAYIHAVYKEYNRHLLRMLGDVSRPGGGRGGGCVAENKRRRIM